MVPSAVERPDVVPSAGRARQKTRKRQSAARGGRWALLERKEPTYAGISKPGWKEVLERG